jgi:DNA-binding NarL/FixJ family response regulator
LKLVQEQAIDAVIVNYRRKGINGVVIANAIRQLRPKVPIIMLCDFPAELPRRVVHLVNTILREGELPEVLLSTIAQLIEGKSGKRGYAS